MFTKHSMRTRPLLATAAALMLLLVVCGGPTSAKQPRGPLPTPIPSPTATPVVTATALPSPTTAPSPTPAPSPSPTPTPSGYPVQYSDSYWRQLALIPSGWAPTACDAAVILSGTTGVCTQILDPVFLLPDGSWGSCPWYADPTVPSGWSLVACAPDPSFEGY